jgi:hypothetical protein
MQPININDFKEPILPSPHLRGEYSRFFIMETSFLKIKATHFQKKLANLMPLSIFP